jgi:hypothetical protein
MNAMTAQATEVRNVNIPPVLNVCRGLPSFGPGQKRCNQYGQAIVIGADFKVMRLWLGLPLSPAHCSALWEARMSASGHQRSSVRQSTGTSFRRDLWTGRASASGRRPPTVHRGMTEFSTT